MTAAVRLCPFPVPRGEAEESAVHNYLWSEAEENARRHRGHLLVSVLTGEKPLPEAARLQVKLVCTACRQAGVLGIYANATVYQPEFYLSAAEMMEDGSLPLLNLVWPGLYRREGGLCAYTDGMRSFGKDEIEVLDTSADPGDLRNFLLDIADYVLENDVVLHDGETIGFGADQRLAITRSAGVWHQGMTLKIDTPLWRRTLRPGPIKPFSPPGTVLSAAASFLDKETPICHTVFVSYIHNTMRTVCFETEVVPCQSFPSPMTRPPCPSMFRRRIWQA